MAVHRVFNSKDLAPQILEKLGPNDKASSARLLSRDIRDTFDASASTIHVRDSRRSQSRPLSQVVCLFLRILERGCRSSSVCINLKYGPLDERKEALNVVLQRIKQLNAGATTKFISISTELLDESTAASIASAFPSLATLELRDAKPSDTVLEGLRVLLRLASPAVNGFSATSADCVLRRQLTSLSIILPPESPSEHVLVFLRELDDRVHVSKLGMSYDGDTLTLLSTHELSRLQSLELAGVPDDVIGALSSRLTGLTHLRLEHITLMAPSGVLQPAAFVGFKDLQVLELLGARLSVYGLVQLTALQRLHVGALWDPLWGEGAVGGDSSASFPLPPRLSCAVIDQPEQQVDVLARLQLAKKLDVAMNVRGVSLQLRDSQAWQAADALSAAVALVQRSCSAAAAPAGGSFSIGVTVHRAGGLIPPPAAAYSDAADGLAALGRLQPKTLCLDGVVLSWSDLDVIASECTSVQTLRLNVFVPAEALPRLAALPNLKTLDLDAEKLFQDPHAAQGMYGLVAAMGPSRSLAINMRLSALDKCWGVLDEAAGVDIPDCRWEDVDVWLPYCSQKEKEVFVKAKALDAKFLALVEDAGLAGFWLDWEGWAGARFIAPESDQESGQASGGPVADPEGDLGSDEQVAGYVDDV